MSGSETCGWWLKYIITNLDTNCRAANMEGGRNRGAKVRVCVKVENRCTHTGGVKSSQCCPEPRETSAGLRFKEKIRCVCNTREETNTAMWRRGCIKHVWLCATPWRPDFLPPTPERLVNHLVPRWSFLTKTEEPGAKTNRWELGRKAWAQGNSCYHRD